MINQLLQNRGFENELESYIPQGSVSTNSDIAYSGIKSALLLSTPASIAEISQVIFFFLPGSPFKFSFFARRFLSEDVKSVSNIRAEVNFLSAIGTVIPPGIVISIRGRDISGDVWNRYDGYAYAPLGALAAQVVIRLEPPESGTSGLLVDDLELVTDVATPAPQPTPAPPAQPGIPAYPGLPLQNLLSTLANLLLPGSPYANMTPPTPASPAQPGVPAFPGFPFAPPPPTPAPSAQPGIPAFPGSPFASPLYPGSPLANLLFPGSPYSNIAPESPGVPKQEDQGHRPSKGGDTPDPGQNEK